LAVFPIVAAVNDSFQRIVRSEVRAVVVCALVVIAACGCQAKPQWSPSHAVLPTADFEGNQVTVHNIRNTEYRTAEDYTVHHYDKTFDLEKLDSVDFIVVPFDEVPGGAHTFLSFGFDGTDYVAVSVEMRRRPGEDFAPVKSFLQPTQIMYVVGDERDLIQLRTIHWMSDVYMYRAQASRAQMQQLFTSVMQRTNKLAEEPENYNLISNNCTTNIVRHVNELAPNRIPYTYQVLFPAFSDELAYDLKLIKAGDSFERTRAEARINEVAYVHRDDPDFSVKIREGHPTLATKSWDLDSSLR
jgi:hypothetical protein